MDRWNEKQGRYPLGDLRLKYRDKICRLNGKKKKELIFCLSFWPIHLSLDNASVNSFSLWILCVKRRVPQTLSVCLYVCLSWFPSSEYAHTTPTYNINPFLLLLLHGPLFFLRGRGGVRGQVKGISKRMNYSSTLNFFISQLIIRLFRLLIERMLVKERTDTDRPMRINLYP